MIYTLENISTARSYEALKRNGFSDLDIVAYYGTPKEDRGTMFIQLKAEAQRVKFNAPKYVVKATAPTEKVGTQKCTEVGIDAVRDMALEHMAKDWVYCGKTFNMNKMGWRFGFNDRKRALGLCSPRNKKVYLSQYYIDHNTREMKMWVNTMVHEIAHAINHQLGGKGHDWQWRDIFTSFGGNGERTSCDAQFSNLLEEPISKYTLHCENCGKTMPSHKIKRRVSACGTCCKELNGGRYTTKYALKQIKNY